MAEIENNKSNKNNFGKRVNKKSTRVDLTPMVDLGFLLITFFVFTSAMSKPRVMNIVSPLDHGEPTQVCESCVLTAILTTDNTILYYEGMQGTAITTKQTDFTEIGLRQLLQKKKNAVLEARGTADEMVLIVKPASASSYKNFVDIIDEVAINGIKHYFIDELNEADKKLLVKK
jgi:biopolymer transport protein ExbD